MKSALVVLAALLSIGLAAAHAERAPKALVQSCAVSSNSRWTPQEKFVWSKVCVGAVADFNETADYGGHLDPKGSEAWPQNRVLRPAFLAMILLRDPYQRVLPRQGVVISGARFTEEVKLENAELQHPLELRDSLLEKGANLSSARLKSFLSFTGSNVMGPLDMEQIALEADLNMQEGRFTEINLIRASVSLLNLDGAKVEGALNMNGFRARQGLFMRDKAEFANVELVHAHVGQVELDSSKVHGSLDMSDLRVDQELFMQKAEFQDITLTNGYVGGDLMLNSSTVSGALRMHGLHVVQSLSMTDSARFADVDLTHAHVEQFDLGGSKVTGMLNLNDLQVDRSFMGDGAELMDVSLANAHVDGQLDLGGSKVAGALGMNGVRVKQSLLMDRKAEFMKDVDLSGAQAGALALNGSKVAGSLGMNSIRVDQWLLMEEGAEFADINLVGAHVGWLSLDKSNVSGNLDMNGLRVDRGLVMRSGATFKDVLLVNATIAGQLSLSGARVTGQFDCYGTEIGQQAFFDGAVFDGLLTCSGIRIRGDLYLDNSQLHNLDLTGAEVGGSLSLGSTQWAQKALLTLRDVKLGTIPALSGGWAPSVDLAGLTYRSTGDATRFEDWLGRFDHFEPQPYDQLATVIQAQGNTTLATAIRYAGRERERMEATGRTWAWQSALKWLIGYGYYPYFAVFWVVGLVLVGALLLRVSGEGRRQGLPYGITYSFDTLLPIIQLRKMHADIDLQGWSRYYFYVQKIMGWILGSFLLAGLSGLTK